ncbi:MAG TPA: hypothetical protein PKB09_00565 [Candidatus Saccharibacteria bacterium]|nr:hypothetical protein [Candidatus Saccharibacteria bacterium]
MSRTKEQLPRQEQEPKGIFKRFLGRVGIGKEKQVPKEALSPMDEAALTVYNRLYASRVDLIMTSSQDDRKTSMARRDRVAEDTKRKIKGFMQSNVKMVSDPSARTETDPIYGQPAPKVPDPESLKAEVDRQTEQGRERAEGFDLMALNASLALTGHGNRGVLLEQIVPRDRQRPIHQKSTIEGEGDIIDSSDLDLLYKALGADEGQPKYTPAQARSLREKEPFSVSIVTPAGLTVVEAWKLGEPSDLGYEFGEGQKLPGSMTDKGEPFRGLMHTIEFERTPTPQAGQ